MIVESVEVHNYRSIESSGVLRLGPVTILVGRNNTGKSSLLRAIYLVQHGSEFDPTQVRVGRDAAIVQLRLGEPMGGAVMHALESTGIREVGDLHELELKTVATREGKRDTHLSWAADGGNRGETSVTVASDRPHHLCVPIFSGRRPISYATEARRPAAKAVSRTDDALTSRLSVLAGDFPGARKYRDLATRVLGFPVATYVVDNGQAPGIPLGEDSGIELRNMGDGVTGTIKLMTELPDEGQHLYLIEEPENDLHPEALRALLEIVVEASGTNQFVISTHSDLVLRELGCVRGAVVYTVDQTIDHGMPTTSFRELADAFEREDALSALGYEAPLPFGWLILEESSAQTFITGALIPLFHPKLAALKVVAARGTGNVSRLFDELGRMVLFAHLSEAERHRAWVLVDGDTSGVTAVKRLSGAYPSWPANRFQALAKDSIEAYYPERFTSQVTDIRQMRDPKRAMELKATLAKAVAAWALAEPQEARDELATSARDVIDHLSAIEADVISEAKATHSGALSRMD